MLENEKNILIFKRSYKSLLKTWIKLGIGKIINFCIDQYDFYKNATITNYDFHGKELTEVQIKKCNKYMQKNLPLYKQVQEDSPDITKSSEYYLYSKIKSPATVCNIGCFYCKADNHFVNLNKKNIVYGLDFKGVIEFNKDFLNSQLKIYEGYPLNNLKIMKNNKIKLNYVLFTRTTNMININELLSYMKVISKIADNVCFLEILKIPAYKKRVLDVNKIDMMNPIKMYSGMYLHNYSAVLKKFGYEVIESEIFHHKKYFNDDLTPDHYFIYVYGSKDGTLIKNYGNPIQPKTKPKL